MSGYLQNFHPGLKSKIQIEIEHQVISQNTLLSSGCNNDRPPDGRIQQTFVGKHAGDGIVLKLEKSFRCDQVGADGTVQADYVVRLQIIVHKSNGRTAGYTQQGRAERTIGLDGDVVAG